MDHKGLVLTILCIFYGLLVAESVAASSYTCGTKCSTSSDCTSTFSNPCTFCLGGVCTPMCGVGCTNDTDCRTGGANPCTFCNEKRQCSNPVPNCGSFCGGEAMACRYNGTGPCGGFSQDCCVCSKDLSKGCVNSANPICGTICADDDDCAGASDNCFRCIGGSCQAPACGVGCDDDDDCYYAKGGCTSCTDGTCQAQPVCNNICAFQGDCDSSCPVCANFACVKSATCGQNCISSGYCQQNSYPCQACVGSICSNVFACGASCGGSDQCGKSCPVCNHVAQCATTWEYERDLKRLEEEGLLAAALQRGEELRRLVREQQMKESHLTNVEAEKALALQRSKAALGV